jgi:hypothetical protein
MTNKKRRKRMPKCPNCATDVNAKWKHCVKCGTNLEDSTYSSDDDPLENLNNKFDRINEFLTDKFPPEDLDNNEPPTDDKNKTRKKPAPKKRKTLFGD